MSSLALLCFKLHKTENSFKFGQRVDEILDQFLIINWASINSQDLSVDLNNQVRNNYIELKMLIGSCENKESEHPFSVQNINNEIDLKYYPIDSKQEREACKSLLSRKRDYIEVLSRDQDALNYDHVNVQLYAIVLIYNNIYYGHIYAWLSKINNDYCFAMGIRNRVDSAFIKYTENNLSNVSHYLLEGVRRFALSKGATNVVITYPKPIMQKILPTLGFERTEKEILDKWIGDSINPPSMLYYCTNCYKLKDTTKPIATNDMTFVLVD